MDDIKYKIRATRKAAGMTQAELAKLVGTTKQNIGNYETGTRKPKLETLAKIAVALNVPIETFLPIMTFDTPEEFHNAQEKIKKEIEDRGGIITRKTRDGEIKVYDPAASSDVFDAEFQKDRINEAINKFNKAGLSELGHQVALLSRIPEFIKEP